MAEKIAGDFAGEVWHNLPDMALGIKPRFQLFPCLLALLWTLLPILSAAQCIHALPTHRAVHSAKSQAVPRCPMCARMAMTGMQMPGMAGMKCSGMKCCCPHGGGMMSCRCSVQPAPKPAAVVSALIWSLHALLPVRLRVLPPPSSPCVYPAADFRRFTLSFSQRLRPPRLL